MGEEQNSDKVRSDLVFLMQCFKEVLIELKEDELAKNLPWLEENLHPMWTISNRIFHYEIHRHYLSRFNCSIW